MARNPLASHCAMDRRRTRPLGLDDAFRPQGTGENRQGVKMLDKIIQTERRCTQCKEVLLESMFYVIPANGKLSTRCNSCIRKNARLYYYKNREKSLYNRKQWEINHPDHKRITKPYQERSQDAKNAIKKNVKNWQLKNKEKVNAEQRLRDAVRYGKIIKPTKCTVCGKESRIVGHHYDYTKPLDVIWLCLKCHNHLHAKDTSRQKREE